MNLKKYGLPAISIGLSLVVSFVVAEVALRFAGYRPATVVDKPFSASWATADSMYGWVNRAGAFVSDEPENRVMSFNLDGSRKDPWLDGKMGSNALGMIVGCSYTQGYGLRDTEVYGSLLNKTGKYVNYINYGTGGYGAYQSLLRLRNEVRVLGKQPKLVIYGFIEDHLQRDVAAPEWVEGLNGADGGKVVPPHVRISREKHVLHEINGEVLDAWVFEKASVLVHLAHMAANKVMIGSVGRLERLDVMSELINELKSTSEDVGAVFILVGLDFLSKDVHDQLQKLGDNFVDCRIPPSGLSPEYRLGGYAHPNEMAHKYWSSCISNAIDRMSSRI